MLTACGGLRQAQNDTMLPSASGSSQRVAFEGRRSSGSSLIKHVIIMVQENRSFDDFFATFPGADGTTTGKTKKGTIKLKAVDLESPCDFGHSRQGFVTDYDDGKMDGFEDEGQLHCNGLAGKRPYQYVKPAQIAPYWDIAKDYVLADETFQTQGSGSFTAHQDLIRGGTTFDQAQTESLVDDPSASPWGCDAPQGTVTPYLLWSGSAITRHANGPAPCTHDFPGSGEYYQTLRDLLDAKSVSWKYYTPPVSGSGRYWSAFDAIYPVRYGPEWKTNVSTPETNIFTDISGQSLPSVSWLIPDEGNSDHPGPGVDQGPSWVASVVNAIGESSYYWPNTAIVIVWDDWGGFYDHVPPPISDHWGGLGFRVPMLIVSPYAREATPSTPGYISPTQYEFGSILRFVEDNWNLGRLGTTDKRANSIADSFDFKQKQRAFIQIPSSRSRSYFMHERPSYRPVDTE